jgi:iron complex outermembrane receptor protein
VTGWKETRDKKGNTRYMVGDMGRNWYKDENLFASLGFEEPDLFDAKFHLYYKDGEYGYSGGKTWLWENGSLVDDGVVEIDDDGVTRKLQISSSKFQSTYGGDLSWGLGLTCVLKIGKQVQIAARIGGSLGDYWYADPSSTSSSTGTRDVWGGLESVFDLKNLDVLGSHKITFGMDFRDEETDCEKWNLNDWKDVDSRTQLSYDMSGRIDIWGIYLQDEWTPFDPLTLYVGCRYDYWMNGDGRSRVWNSGIGGYVADSYGSDSEGVFSYKIAAVFKPLKMTTLRGSFGTSFRGPDATELYKTWAYGSSIYPGNPQLKPERNLAWEIGLTQRIGSIGEFLKKSSITAVVFDNHLDDYIYRKTLDAAGVADYNAEHGTAYSNVKTYDNVARARIYGLELGAKAEFPLGISVFVNWTHLNARVVENDANPASEGKMLPYVPRNVCSVGIAFKQTVEDRHAFSARLAGRFVERVFTTDDNSDCKQHVFGAYEDFFVVDLKISYSFDDQYRFSFWVDNLFDELYFQYYKAPGRSIGCSVDVKF